MHHVPGSGPEMENYKMQVFQDRMQLTANIECTSSCGVYMCDVWFAPHTPTAFGHHLGMRYGKRQLPNAGKSKYVRYFFIMVKTSPFQSLCEIIQRSKRPWLRDRDSDTARCGTRAEISNMQCTGKIEDKTLPHHTMHG